MLLGEKGRYTTGRHSGYQDTEPGKDWCNLLKVEKLALAGSRMLYWGVQETWIYKYLIPYIEVFFIQVRTIWALPSFTSMANQPFKWRDMTHSVFLQLYDYHNVGNLMSEKTTCW
jgi:hypothetical protein